ncbi:hypothetical protein FFLO_07037 [Filobasidium floriforme]|uniref:Uncharacterized protein n=1 Tax=Filobasidium floriforme TaxID=5210 RepID=A0A8K0JDQ1_9TREE|nr:hypothetical protein FFLO_07037 [Filobasidium floriforme]
MFTGSPFSNNRRPTLNDPRQPPYNAATTHPASIRPPSSFSLPPSGQSRVHVTLAGQGCDKERAWIDQWQTMKEHWHPAALAPGKSAGSDWGGTDEVEAMNEVDKAGEGWTKTVCQCAGTTSLQGQTPLPNEVEGGRTSNERSSRLARRDRHQTQSVQACRQMSPSFPAYSTSCLTSTPTLRNNNDRPAESDAMAIQLYEGPIGGTYGGAIPTCLSTMSYIQQRKASNPPLPPLLLVNHPLRLGDKQPGFHLRTPGQRFPPSSLLLPPKPLLDRPLVDLVERSINGNMLKSGKSSVCTHWSTTAVPDYHRPDPRFDPDDFLCSSLSRRSCKAKRRSLTRMSCRLSLPLLQSANPQVNDRNHDSLGFPIIIMFEIAHLLYVGGGIPIMLGRFMLRKHLHPHPRHPHPLARFSPSLVLLAQKMSSPS